MGAEPKNPHPRWQAADPISRIWFSLDESEYLLLRRKRRFGLFNSENRLIKSASSSVELSDILSNLFDYGLHLSNQKGKLEQAPPAFLYLPFFFNQDSSWSDTWAGFEKLGQFSSWQKDTADFHVGLRSSEYFRLKARLSDAKRTCIMLEDKLQALTAMMKRMQRKIQRREISFDLDAYKEDIEELITESNKLQDQQNALKSKMISIQNEHAHLNRQLIIARTAREELTQDFDYAGSVNEQEVECPTCGAEYDNDVLVRFEIASDADRCTELIVEIEDDLEANESKLQRLHGNQAEIESQIARVEHLLESRRGAIRLKEIISSMGHSEVRGVLAKDLRICRRAIRREHTLIDQFNRQLRKINDRKRRKIILNYLSNKYETFCEYLDVDCELPSKLSSAYFRVKDSGSDLPRAVLAYSYAVLHTMSIYGSGTFCPIVIDSPNQQDQDLLNWPRIVKFIDTQTADSWQLVLGSVDLPDGSIGGKTVRLTNKRALMQQVRFDVAKEETNNLLEQIYANELL